MVHVCCLCSSEPITALLGNVIPAAMEPIIPLATAVVSHMQQTATQLNAAQDVPAPDSASSSCTAPAPTPPPSSPQQKTAQSPVLLPTIAVLPAGLQAQQLQPGNMPASGMSMPPQLARSGSSSTIDNAVKRAPPPAHTWSACPSSSFKVRCGPNYKATGKKAPSADAIYETFAVDVYQSSTKLSHIGRVAALPADPAPPPADCGLPPYVIINWMVPNYAPGGLLGGKKTNGPGWNLVLYCRLSDSVRAMLHDGTAAEQPSIDLLRRYMHPTGGSVLRGTRLKCVFGLIDKEAPAFGMVMKQMIKSYNFKPFLSKTASFCYWGKDYFEIDIDIHTWGTTALSGFNTIKEKIPQLLLRGGVVIEAEGDSEMPEQMLANVLLSRVDPKRAPPFPPELASYLAESGKGAEPLPRASRVRAGNAASLESSPPASCSASPQPSDEEEDDDEPQPPATLRS